MNKLAVEMKSGGIISARAVFSQFSDKNRLVFITIPIRAFCGQGAHFFYMIPASISCISALLRALYYTSGRFAEVFPVYLFFADHVIML